MAGAAGCLGSDDGAGTSEPTSDGTTGGTASGSGSSDPKLADQINVYTFGGVNGEGIKKAFIDPFSEEFGVEINHQTISSGWDLIPKIKNDSVDAHVVEQNPGSVLGGIPGVWQKIRLDNIPTVLENLQLDRLRGDAPEASFDPGDDWHYVPKEVWAQGLVYNHDKVEKPGSWQDIYTGELKGQLTNTGFVALALGVAGSESGVDFNQIQADSDVSAAMWDRLETQNEYVYQWWDSGSTAQQLLSRESALAGNFWYGRVASLLDQENVPISYTVPEEGTGRRYYVNYYSVCHY
jgi:spermidine/putrescine transport system substrate-binding protein